MDIINKVLILTNKQGRPQFLNPKIIIMLQNNSISFISMLFVALLFIVSISACQTGQKKESNDVSIEDFISDDVIFDDIDKAKKIFYSLPSPLETALIISQPERNSIWNF